MFRNTDRHLSNLGFVLSPQGTLHPAPIFDNGLALGVSEGAYFDLDNLIKGYGYSIKPFEVSVRFLQEVIKPHLFHFSVEKFLLLHDKRVPKNSILLGFLNLLVKYYPKDSKGIDTYKALESHFGPFNRKRFLS